MYAIVREVSVFLWMNTQQKREPEAIAMFRRNKQVAVAHFRMFNVVDENRMIAFAPSADVVRPVQVVNCAISRAESAVTGSAKLTKPAVQKECGPYNNISFADLVAHAGTGIPLI